MSTVTLEFDNATVTLEQSGGTLLSGGIVAGLNAANLPSADNPFATLADMNSAPDDITLTQDHIIVGSALNVGADTAPGALTRVDDTNVTLTLGGDPSKALVKPVSLTLGWTGQLPPARGGTGVNNGANTLTLTGSLTVTGGGTLALGGYTLTVPGTGTAALMNYANTGSFRVSADSDSGYVAIGAVPAATGAVRLPYGSSVYFRNGTNTADVAAFSVGTGDSLRIGFGNTTQTRIHGGGAIVVFFADSTASSYARVNGTSASEFMALNAAKLDAPTYYLTHYINSAVYSNPVFGIYGNGRDHVFVGAVDTTTGQTLTIKPFADRVGLRVTGFPMQAVDRTLVYIGRNDSNTNAVGIVLTAAVNTTGTGAAGLGGSIDLRLESSTTADMQAAMIEWLWTDATHASRTVLYRGKTTGNATNTGYYGHWNHSAVADSAITVIPNGGGDVTRIATFIYAVAEVTGAGTSGGTITLTPGGGAVTLYDDGTDTLQITCAADGSVTVQRSAGADTFKVSLWGTWV